ncbi:CYTH domain-containing protein [bacterium]|nr:CYTH domain-containing protein [bacterium]
MDRGNKRRGEKNGCMAIESEIKFTVTDRTVFDRIAALDEIASWRTLDQGIIRHTDTYFDTVDYRMCREKIVFRLRTTGHGSVLALKAEAPSGEGFFRRIEVEAETMATAEDIVHGHLPDLPPVSALFDRIGIVNLFRSLESVNNRRVILLARGGEKADYELVLDDVTFCGAKGKAAVLELEVESLAGAENGLNRIGQWLNERFDLKEAGPSKYILGMELVGGMY